MHPWVMTNAPVPPLPHLPTPPLACPLPVQCFTVRLPPLCLDASGTNIPSLLLPVGAVTGCND